MTNEEIRGAIRSSGFRYWQVAEAAGIRPDSLSVKLRHELEPEEKQKLLRVVEQLKQKKEV